MCISSYHPDLIRDFLFGAALEMDLSLLIVFLQRSSDFSVITLWKSKRKYLVSRSATRQISQHEDFRVLAS